MFKELFEAQADFTVIVKNTKTNKHIGENPFGSEKEAKAFISKNFTDVQKPDKYDTISAIAKDKTPVEITIIKNTKL